VTPQDSRKNRILVVDDDPLLLAFLETALADVGSLSVAESGERAIELAKTTPPPDLILLDVGMPGMDGHEVCRKLKADPATRDIPVIFATAANQEQDEAKGFKLGAADYITKPFRLPVLRARVLTHLHTHQLWLQMSDYRQRLEDRVRERTAALEAEIQTRRQAEAQLARQLFRDPFTELPNRLQLQRNMLDRVERRAPFSVLLVSLLNFHEINNTLGYQTGNRLLRQLTARISGWLARRPHAQALDGDERLAVLSGVNFGMLFDGGEPSERLMETAQTLLDAVEQPIDFEGMSLSVNAVIGIALWPRHGDGADTVLRHAHVAVEEATLSDRRIVMYSEATTATAPGGCRSWANSAPPSATTTCPWYSSRSCRSLAAARWQPKRCCAGSTRCWARSGPTSSCRSPSRPASSGC
jgi:diguanylate cyclase (GGDEF)-like protein